MPVNFYPQIKVNSIYLTQSGADGGTRYIAKVTGLDGVATPKAVTTIKALSLKPYVQVLDSVKGRDIGVEFPLMNATDYAAIRDEINDAIDTNSTIALEFLGGAYGDITGVSAVPDTDPVRFPGEYENGRLKNVSFHFVRA